MATSRRRIRLSISNWVKCVDTNWVRIISFISRVLFDSILLLSVVSLCEGKIHFLLYSSWGEIGFLEKACRGFRLFVFS